MGDVFQDRQQQGEGETRRVEKLVWAMLLSSVQGRIYRVSWKTSPIL